MPSSSAPSASAAPRRLPWRCLAALVVLALPAEIRDHLVASYVVRGHVAIGVASGQPRLTICERAVPLF